MITSIYASLLTLFIVWLSLNVIRLRRSNKVRLGDGGHSNLQVAIRAHGNAVEYIPLSLVLLALLEFAHARAALIHAGGIAMLVGRVLHARGLLTETLRLRVLGMQLTLLTLIALALANLGYALLGRNFL